MSLPPRYARKYNSAYLKAKIADVNMWSMIPGVEPDICGLDGARRMKQNELLFEFIDQYFPDAQYAFEPNMADGRFIMLPDNPSHQGMPWGHPSVVEVHYTDPDTGTVHVYYSRYLYVNVGDMLTGEEVPVYLDRDSGTGFVDIDAVLPKIEVHRT